ncbi:DNA binding domain protein, excisionase family [Candidatus Desulfosporosinus infrequens]|uniref:DNA binding domain protein, excisionase family n=1 Tax=Candidatus Desulfosporosinus infrequens TaxID=2043169 RepID=A0A2U3LIC6_9FIRM|nr:DNA binding domain protein, excisionase family [Candidatus Desulfosporosinus infrequens]
MHDEKYYSPNDIAEKFNIKADTVRKWINQGKLKALKLGDIWRIPESSLDKFIKENNN